MRGILILEGPDCCGKTTLARYLEKEHGALYVHHGWSKGYDVGVRFLANLRRAAELAEERLVVLDRAWLSSDGYGTVYRGASDVPRRGRMLQRLALRHSVLTVFCLPRDISVPIELHRKLKSERSEMYTDISAIVGWFSNLYSLTGDPAARRCYADLLAAPWESFAGSDGYDPRPYFQTRYDFTDEGRDLRTYAAYLAEELEELRDGAVTPNTHLCNLGGHPQNAKALLVGDEAGPRAGCVRWPFVSGSETAGCSGWFAEQLNLAGLLEEEVLWTNAHAPADQDILEVLLDDLSLPVLALGQRAAHRLRRLGVPFQEREHPQYVKRFKHALGLEYAQDLVKTVRGGTY